MLKKRYMALTAALTYIIWQKWELSQFKITTYEAAAEKWKGSLNIAVVADLHAHVYGKNNDILFQKIREQNPDIILVPGDMIISKYTDSYEMAYQAFEELVKIAPVYFSYGNHESRVCRVKVRQTRAYLEYEKRVRCLGVHFLGNETEMIEVRGQKMALSGLEVPLKCYTKGENVPLPKDFLKNTLGESDKTHLHILMAHNPMYAEEYAAWGADITVCGHTHGGLVRIPGFGSLISPQLTPFPKYDGGFYQVNGKKVCVSKGLGTHTFHIRIFDRAEVVMLKIN